ncbi:Putative mitochondrial protein [Glycine soja]|uniref:Putative mitochondrial protein n=1 Tax=Glycine soja TaxID=3848 RepID=A0A0B2PTX8_GLYSO|nr:Putative mitochondrial protein [Glycine soja]
MRFRNTKVFNMALLGKQGWSIMNNPNMLVAKLLRAKYYSQIDFVEVALGNNPSHLWRSI